MHSRSSKERGSIVLRSKGSTYEQSWAQGFLKTKKNFAYIHHFWSFLGWHKQKERFKMPGLKRHCTRTEKVKVCLRLHLLTGIFILHLVYFPIRCLATMSGLVEEKGTVKLYKVKALLRSFNGHSRKRTTLLCNAFNSLCHSPFLTTLP